MNRLAALLPLAALLAGCDLTFPWTTPETPDALSLSAGAVEFAARPGGSAPAAQEVVVTTEHPEAMYVGAGFPDSAPAWLEQPVLSGSGSRWTVRLRPRAPAPAAGTYTCVVRVAVGRADYTTLAQRDIAVTYRVAEVLSASPATLAFGHGLAADAPPPDQEVRLEGAGLAWTASANRAWLRVRTTSGTAPGPLAVGVDPAGLAIGSHAGEVAVTATGTGQVLRIPVQLAVEDTGFRPVAALSFAGVNGAPLPAQALEVATNDGSAASFTATASASWVVLSATSGDVPATLTVTADPSRPSLASGAHAATVTLTGTSGGRSFARTVPVSLALARPTLTVSPGSLAPGGATGREGLGPVDLSVSLDTGAGAWPFTVTGSAGWVVLEPASGVASSSPATVRASWDLSAIAPGSHGGSLSVRVVVNGDVLGRTVPIALKADARRLLASQAGVALVSTPGLARTTRSLEVKDNLGQATAWTAAADQPWLTVTSSGVAPADALVLTADPAGLAADAVHEATVTVTPAVTGVQPETIRVGLWVGSATPANLRLPVSFTRVVVDPVRPLAYVHAGGSDLTVYNVYTGAVVTTLGALAPQLGEMTIAPDGSRLLVSDATDQRLVPVELPALARGTPWPLASAGPLGIEWIRTNGRHLLVAGTGVVADPVLGVELGSFFPGGWYGYDRLAASGDGTRFATINRGLSPSSFSVHALDWTDLDGGTPLVSRVGGGSSGSNGRDVALSPDGTRLYSACGAPYQFPVYDVSAAGTPVALPALAGSPYPNNVEVTVDGRIVAGASVWYDPVDVWVYDPGASTPARTFRLGGYARAILDNQLRVAGDGLRLVALSEDPALHFVTIGP
jgi:hypothetical protein